MTEAVIFKNARYVLKMNNGEVMENVDVRVQEGKIEAIGQNLRQRGDRTIDCSRSIIMPGLVNSHTHAAMVMLRGLN
ncbi:MAG: N-ethylammeline chlorohydrolase, partial [Thermoplasmatota archaeon]